MKQIREKIWLSVRRVQSKGKAYTAGDFQDNNTIHQMVKLDEGYKIFLTVCGSLRTGNMLKKMHLQWSDSCRNHRGEDKGKGENGGQGQ